VVGEQRAGRPGQCLSKSAQDTRQPEGANGCPHALRLAFIQLRCALGKCLLKTTTDADYPELVEVHKLSGEHCTMLKARASSLAHLEGFIERLGTHGEMRTHIVLSTQFEGRSVQQAIPERPVTRSKGWS
jgi:Lrp/AsnC family leucine-responsive transcriptional regulator